MLLSIKKDAELSIELDKRFKKYLLSLKIRSKYFNYDAYSKIRYENIISIIENIENMIFSKYRCVDNIYLNKIEFNFEQSRTAIKVYINISDNQQYSVTLSRKNVINLYNYLVNYIKTFNKIQMTDFNKKYTYVDESIEEGYIKYSLLDYENNDAVGYVRKQPTVSEISGALQGS